MTRSISFAQSTSIKRHTITSNGQKPSSSRVKTTHPVPSPRKYHLPENQTPARLMMYIPTRCSTSCSRRDRRRIGTIRLCRYLFCSVVNNDAMLYQVHVYQMYLYIYSFLEWQLVIIIICSKRYNSFALFGVFYVLFHIFPI